MKTGMKIYHNGKWLKGIVAEATATYGRLILRYPDDKQIRIAEIKRIFGDDVLDELRRLGVVSI
jgi:hypothetical protein